MDAKTIRSIDLFCGAGGLSLGLASRGVRTVLAVDNWKPALKTFERNFPTVPVAAGDAGAISPEDLLEMANLDGPPDLMVGGPPCQGFSSAGARKVDDPRNSLVGSFARLIAEIRPSAFIFENVEGFLTSSNGGFVDALLDPLIGAGYWIHLRKINVANYGVPQLRKRVVALGLLGATPQFPSPTHRAKGAPGVDRVGSPDLPMTPSLMQCLEHLPRPAEAPPGSPSDHYSRPLRHLDFQRINTLRPGQTMRDLPLALRHPSYERRANRRVADGTPTERRGGAPAGIRRLSGDEPSKAITSAASREFAHPFEDRMLSLRECAALQTFPDDFVFAGNASQKATLIGNAVPPLFAGVLADAVIRSLPLAYEVHGPGRLVSFIPTNGYGMSPSLRDVCDRVNQRHLVGQRSLLESY